MLALRLILKNKGGKQHCLLFVGSNLGVEMFLKKKKHPKATRVFPIPTQAEQAEDGEHFAND